MSLESDLFSFVIRFNWNMQCISFHSPHARTQRRRWVYKFRKWHVPWMVVYWYYFTKRLDTVQCDRHCCCCCCCCLRIFLCVNKRSHIYWAIRMRNTFSNIARANIPYYTIRNFLHTTASHSGKLQQVLRVLLHETHTHTHTTFTQWFTGMYWRYWCSCAYIVFRINAIFADSTVHTQLSNSIHSTNFFFFFHFYPNIVFVCVDSSYTGHYYIVELSLMEWKRMYSIYTSALCVCACVCVCENRTIDMDKMDKVACDIACGGSCGELCDNNNNNKFIVHAIHIYDSSFTRNT